MGIMAKEPDGMLVEAHEEGKEFVEQETRAEYGALTVTFTDISPQNVVNQSRTKR